MLPGIFLLCVGKSLGCEVAVHSVREQFLNAKTEAALLVGASNAFNTFDRMSGLHNVRHSCPTVFTILINTYRATSDLYIEGEMLYSQEGTTQGYSLVMPFYALATVPLINKQTSTLDQTWYADHAAATGKTTNLQCQSDARYNARTFCCVHLQR